MKIYDVTLKYTCVREDAEPSKVNQPELVAKFMADAFEINPEQEAFWVILLNRKNQPKGRIMITLGTATSSLAHPREVFRAAIMASATAIVCVHNHPSGDPAPSSADLLVTRQLREASKVVDIELLDHVICGRAAADPLGKGYYSFREAGIL